MWVRPKPIMMQGRRLMSDQPEGANARSHIALLPLAVGFLPLELNLSFNGDGPGFSRPAAQDICPPILTIRCCPRLLRQGVPTRGSSSNQALGFDVKMEVAFLCSPGSLPRRVREETCSKARCLGNGPPFPIWHPRIAISR